MAKKKHIEPEDVQLPASEESQVGFVVVVGFSNQTGWHQIGEDYTPYSDFDRKSLLRAGYIELKK